MFYKRGAIFFCVDCGDIANGFPMKDWAVQVKEYHSDEVADRDFKKQWATAKEERVKKLRRLADMEVLPAWQERHVDRSSFCGVLVSAHLKFMDSAAHHGRFLVYPLASRVFPLLLEDGITVSDGVLIRPTGNLRSSSHLWPCATSRSSGSSTTLSKSTYVLLGKLFGQQKLQKP